jgi:N-methylhydantoinase B
MREHHEVDEEVRKGPAGWTIRGGEPSFAPDRIGGTLEALRLPATKLYKAGTLNEEVRDLIEHNVRFSRQWWGDVQSQIASNITAERRIQALIRKSGLNAVLNSFTAARDYSRARFLNAMKAMPNASVTVNDIYMEDDGFGDGPYRVQISLTKTPEKIIVDFAGRDPQSMPVHHLSLERSARPDGFVGREG